VIDHNEIYGNRIGIMHGNFFQIRNNYLHDNWQYGVTSYLSTGSVIQDNEFTRNAAQSGSHSGDAGSTKFGSVTNTTVQHNYFHGNNSNAIWFDGNLDTGNVIADNTVTNNPDGNGIFSEASGQSVISGNTVSGSIRGIYISASHDTEVYGNTVTSSDRAFALFQDGSRIGESDLYNNFIHDNTVLVPTTSILVGVVPMAVTLNCTVLTNSQCSAYSTSRGNRFEGNRYAVPNPTGSWWLWNNGTMTFPQWQSAGEDITGGAS
jgi:parallel beta-helix repeat protein